MTIRQTLVAGLMVAGLCAPAVAADKPATLKFCHEDVDVYPWVLKDRPGLNIIHLKAVEQKLGVKIETSPLPWKRCQEDLREGKVDGIFAASFKTERLVAKYGDFSKDLWKTLAEVRESADYKAKMAAFK